jgi:hypothetical protein
MATCWVKYVEYGGVKISRFYLLQLDLRTENSYLRGSILKKLMGGWAPIGPNYHALVRCVV